MHKLVTPSGWEFNAGTFVKIGEQYYDVDEMNEEQRNYVAVKSNLRGLNSAYAGKAEFQAEGLPPFKKVFPDTTYQST